MSDLLNRAMGVETWMRAAKNGNASGVIDLIVHECDTMERMLGTASPEQLKEVLPRLAQARNELGSHLPPPHFAGHADPHVARAHGIVGALIRAAEAVTDQTGP